MSALTEVASVPVDDLIESVAMGIANAQYRLDLNGIRIAQLMSGLDKSKRVSLGTKTYSLLELGFTPTFYQFVDTVIEVKVSISVTQSQQSSTQSSDNTTTEVASRKKMTTNVSSVTASYSSKYQYSGEASSLVRTKIVPVPAPALLGERIRDLIAAEEEARKQQNPLIPQVTQ